MITKYRSAIVAITIVIACASTVLGIAMIDREIKRNCILVDEERAQPPTGKPSQLNPTFCHQHKH